tara:strand:- start:375 stop:947 length:573 start_codon:yes stop_codon:yes gene_type:complete
MFIVKKYYYLYLEDTKLFDLSLIKKREKFTVIYRNNLKKKNIAEIKLFRNKCKSKGIKFYIANDIKLANMCKADGLYISAYNKQFLCNFKILQYMDIIGSAHNVKEINQKLLQGCKNIIFSRIFKTDYVHKSSYLGLVRFNNLLISTKLNLIPLGGIRVNNLNKLRSLKTNSASFFSEVKKKPALISRLF